MYSCVLVNKYDLNLINNNTEGLVLCLADVLSLTELYFLMVKISLNKIPKKPPVLGLGFVLFSFHQTCIQI